MTTDDLSPRMKDVLRLVGGQQWPYKRVAKELGISVHTVETYAVKIRDRAGLDLSPRNALTVLYYQDLDEAPTL